MAWLAEYADFSVNVNSVRGGSVRQPDDALTVDRRARGLGFSGTVGITPDH